MLEKVRSFASKSDDGIAVTIVRSVLRLFQIIVALVVIGMYGQDVSSARKNDVSVDGRWAYGVAVGGLSFIAAAVLAFPKIPSRKLFPVDAVLWLLWLVLFGIFGKMFISEDCEGNGKCDRMKTTVWFDLIGMLLWAMTAIIGGVLFRRERQLGLGGGSVV